jgi:hypothetical protein
VTTGGGTGGRGAHAHMVGQSARSFELTAKVENVCQTQDQKMLAKKLVTASCPTTHPVQVGPRLPPAP